METAIRYQGAAFLIHGTGDRVAPYSCSKALQKHLEEHGVHLMEEYDHGFSRHIEGRYRFSLEFSYKAFAMKEILTLIIFIVISFRSRMILFLSIWSVSLVMQKELNILETSCGNCGYARLSARWKFTSLCTLHAEDH